MSYLCNHGYMRVSCPVCVMIEEAVEEFMVKPESEEANEWMYDLYLEQDEKLLTESEEK